MASVRPLLHVAAALAVLVGTLGALVVRGVFALRHDYVAEHLCENRHDPGSDCDGRCFLKKRMEAVDGHATAGHGGHGEPEAPAVVPTPPVLQAVAAAAPTVPPDRWRPPSEPLGWASAAAASGAAGEVFRPPRQG